MPSVAVHTQRSGPRRRTRPAGSVRRLEALPRRPQTARLFDAPLPAAESRTERSKEEIIDAHRRDRPGGARFGELVHAVLASIALAADHDAVRALTEVQARILSAPADEITTACDLITRVLGHKLLDRARAAAARGMCRRETPVTLSSADGTLVEGIVDLAFEENGTWTIIDYKTDREMAAAGEDRYRRQVELYASAIAQATGKPATGILIRDLTGTGG